MNIVKGMVILNSYLFQCILPVLCSVIQDEELLKIPNYNMSNNRCPQNKIFLFSFLNKYRCVSPDAFLSLISNETFTLVMTLLYQNTDTQMPYFLKTV
jgi:hypothetical protein